MIMKKILLPLIFIVQAGVFAQNDVQISHFMFCGQSYNPAIAGLTKSIDVALLAREQWAGFDEAPSTQLLNLSNHTENLGSFGLSAINDRLGHEKSINIRGIYSYPFRISENSFIHAGVGIGFINRCLDGTKLTYEEKMQIDPTGVYAAINEYNPTIDFGLVFSNQKLTLGLSTTHLTKSLSGATFYNISRHYYFFGNYTIKAGENTNVIPALYIKSDKFITQYELNTNVIFNDKYWFGLSYRYDDAIVGLIGIKVYKNIKVGYSYDFDTGDVEKYSSGSHEILIMASFDKPKKTSFYLKSPRLFN